MVHMSRFPCSYDVLLLILCLAAYFGLIPVNSLQTVSRRNPYQVAAQIVQRAVWEWISMINSWFPLTTYISTLTHAGLA